MRFPHFCFLRVWSERQKRLEVTNPCFSPGFPGVWKQTSVLPGTAGLLLYSYLGGLGALPRSSADFGGQANRGLGSSSKEQTGLAYPESSQGRNGGFNSVFLSPKKLISGFPNYWNRFGGGGCLSPAQNGAFGIKK